MSNLLKHTFCFLLLILSASSAFSTVPGNALDISNVNTKISQVKYKRPTVTVVTVTKVEVDDGKVSIQGKVRTRTVIIHPVAEKSIGRMPNGVVGLTEGETYLFALLPPKEMVLWSADYIMNASEIGVIEIPNPIYIATNVFGENVYPITREAFDYDADKLYPIDENKVHKIEPYKPKD